MKCDKKDECINWYKEDGKERCSKRYFVAGIGWIYFCERHKEDLFVPIKTKTESKPSYGVYEKMKGKIDTAGCLCIERAGEMKLQYCRRSDKAYCGDRCPHFGEPTLIDSRGHRFDRIDLDLCEGKTLSFKANEFGDERSTTD